MDGGRADEEVLDTGPGRASRWLTRLAGLAVVGVVTGVLVHASAGGSRHQPSATGAARAPAAADVPVPSLPSPADPPLLGPPVRPLISDARDLVMGANLLYVVRRRGVAAYDFTNRRLVADVAVPEMTAGRYRATPDLGSNALWLIREGATEGSDAVELDATTLRRRATVRVPPGVRSVAAVDGRVFLAAAGSVWELRAGQAVRALPAEAGLVQSLAGDARRDRLLILATDTEDAAESRLIAERPDGTQRVAVAIPLSAGQVVALRDAIWVGGTTGLSGRHAEIMRLDPDTLVLAGTEAELAARLGSGARFAAAGSRVVWVRATGPSAALWCLDGQTGAVSARFADLPGPVASQDGFGPVTDRLSFAYAAPGGVLRPLALRGCLG